MKFYIVTPSYNQLDWLKRCVASIADQVLENNTADGCRTMVGRGSVSITNRKHLSTDETFSVTVHHHIQDACSKDGTVEFLKEYVRRQPATDNYQLTFSSETDNGMYDAINKGWRLAPADADIIAHLNCDEQYLPGALKTLTEFFRTHQKADVVLADMIVVDKSGGYICHRRSLKPYAVTSRFCCGGFTAATFHRVSVIKKKKVFFDTSWRNFGDKVWYNALHQAGCRFAVCNQLVAVFTDTGANLNWTDEGCREKKRYEKEFLNNSARGTQILSRINGVRRLIKDLTLIPLRSYDIFTAECGERTSMSVKNPTGLWHKKWNKS